MAKDELIRLLIANKLRAYVITNKLVEGGARFRLGELFELTPGDLREYFNRQGFPPLDKSRQGHPPFIGDYETVWAIIDGEYCALWLEKGTSSNLYSSPSRVEFQAWWNENLIKDLEFQLDYPWSL